MSPFQITLRRYQAAGLLLAGMLMGSVSLFSRDDTGRLAGVRPLPAPRRPCLALTFDDGPHPGATDRLLKALDERRVPATFFVVGKQAARHPDLLLAMDRRGHEIANHTYGHPNLTVLPKAEVARELHETRRLIGRLLHKDTWLFRPPGGRYDEATLEAAYGSGYRMVLWTVFPRDHEAPSPEVIYERVMASARDGGVVLLHSGVESTVRALPRIIDDLRARGYRFLTVSQMLQDGIDPSTLSAWYLPKNASPALTANAQSLAYPMSKPPAKERGAQRS